MKILFASILLFWGISGIQAQKVDKSNLKEILEALNTKYDEQDPVLYPNGRELYFVRANDSLNVGGSKDKGDIWYATLGENGRWEKPENIGSPVNNDLKNSLLGFSPDGDIMFLNLEEKHPGGLISNQGIGYSLRKNGQWTVPKKMSVDYFVNRSKNQSGSVSRDGKVLVLSMDSYASRGEEDIYVCFYEDGKFGQPVNLGDDINTSYQEMTPYLASDNKTLYFSSNGHGGLGGRDVFVSQRLDDTWKKWSKPKNIEAINTNGVDYYYFIDYDNEIAYFISTQNSDGYGDIQAIDVSIEEQAPEEKADFAPLAEISEMPVNTTMIFSGKVLNTNTKEPVAAAIQLRSGDILQNINTGENGIFNTELPADLVTANLDIKAPGYMSSEEQVKLQSGSGDDYVFYLVPLEVGTTIRLSKVYFERSTANLIDSSYTELNRVADMLQENPNVKIELSGHTDNQGDSRLNLKLSQERVDVVKKYLVDKGIEDSRIKGKGYGGTRPVASNESEETRKLNRRVEFKILKD